MKRREHIVLYRHVSGRDASSPSPFVQAHPPRRPAKGVIAFTLLELLVVIATMAILLGMLLPALGKARERGKAINCVGNVRQLLMGIHQYVDDWNDSLPFQKSPTWYDVVGNAYLGIDVNQMKRRDSVFTCPSDSLYINYSATNSDKLIRVSYAINGSFPRKTTTFIGMAMLKMREIKDPSVCAFLVDFAKKTSGDTLFFNSVPLDSYAYRHLGSMNVGYGDGHVGEIGFTMGNQMSSSHLYYHPFLYGQIGVPPMTDQY